MNTIATCSETFESTYALLVRSEEKQRGRFEALIYTLLIASTMLALSQFGREAAMMPSSVMRNSVTVTATPQHGA